MISKIGFRILKILFLFTLLNSCGKSLEVSTDRVNKPVRSPKIYPLSTSLSVEEWMQKYTHSSIFGATQKLHELAIKEDKVAELIDREVDENKINFKYIDGPILDRYSYKDENGNDRAYDLRAIHYELGNYSWESFQNAGPNERDQFMLDQVLQEIDARDEHTLLIILTGIFHTVDVFLNRPDQDITYTTLPANLDSPLVPPEFVQKVQTDDRYKDNEQIKRWSKADFKHFVGVFVSGSIRRIMYNKLKGLNIPRNKIFKTAKATSPKVIAFGDIHGLQSFEPFNSFPNAKNLREIGVNRILLLSEAIPVSLGEMNLERYGLELQKNLHANEFIKNIRNLEIRRAYEDGKMVFFPAFESMQATLNQLENELPVVVKGLEPSDMP